jgi:hypothetical protein
MPVRSRPIRPDMLFDGEGSTQASSRESKLKKYNFTSLYIDNGIDLGNFSFLGDHGSTLDYMGPSVNLLYGRVDGNGDAISPKLNVLDSVGASNSSKFAINFVAQAFNQFRSNFTSERSGRNALKIRDSSYRGLQPKKAFVNVDTEHSLELERLFQNNLMPFLMNSAHNTNIVGFHEFLRLFIGKFLSNVMLERNKTSLLRSQFALSNSSTPLISGMVIEVADVDHNNDKAKFEDWISSSAYSVIKTGAATHGFIMDKHAPWRFIANLNSPRMLNYIQGKGLLVDKSKPSRLRADGTPFQVDDVFSLYYDKIYLRDIEILKQTILNMYNNFASLKKHYSYPSITQCAPAPDEMRYPAISVKSKLREKYTMEQLENDYSMDFWLNQYLILRLLEGGVRVNEDRLYRQFKKISQINKYLSYGQALTYVNEYAKLYSGFSPEGQKGVNSISKYAFSKTANPQISGVAKSIEPPEVDATSGY